jgi:nucleoside-diphosphate-sugar epimerase
MRVVVAGASGAVGARLVPQLAAAGHDVVALTRTPGSLAGTGSEVREVVADIANRRAFLAALDGIRADAVVHQLTALAKPPLSHADMRETNRLRAEGTSTLIAAARAVGARKLVAASFFGGYGFRDHGRLPLQEDAPFGEEDGRNDAVLTALLSLELQVRAFGGVALRYGLFYGDKPRSVSPVARQWKGLLPMVHLEDAASAVLSALVTGKPGTVYNIADDEPLSYRAREKAIAAKFGLKPPMVLPDGMIRTVAPFASQLLTRTAMKLDTTRAHDELGWSPAHPSITAWAAERASGDAGTLAS